MPSENDHAKELMRLLCVWYNLVLNPIGIPFQISNFPRPQIPLEENNLDTPVLEQDFALIEKDQMILCKMTTLDALCKVILLLDLEHCKWFWENVLMFYSNSNYAFQVQLNFIFICKWITSSENLELKDEIVQFTNQKLEAHFTQAIKVDYSELVPHLKKLKSECFVLINTLTMDHKVDPQSLSSLKIHNQVKGESPDGFSVQDAKHITTEGYQEFIEPIVNDFEQDIKKSIIDRKNGILESILFIELLNSKLQIQVQTSLSITIVQFQSLPDKFNPIIQSLLASIKLEENCLFRELTCDAIADLIHLLQLQNKSVIIDKIIDTLCQYLTLGHVTDLKFTDEDQIYSLVISQSDTKRKVVVNNEDEITKLGAQLAFQSIFFKFGKDLFIKVPKIKTNLFDKLIMNDQDELMNNFALLEILVPFLNESILGEVERVLMPLFEYLKSEAILIRYKAAQCLSSITGKILLPAMKLLVNLGIEMLQNPNELYSRRGAAEALYLIVQKLDALILPYVIFLVAPILGRMSDNDDHTRLICTNTFAMLIDLIPLESGIPNPDGFDQALIEQKTKERKFLSQLLDMKQIEHFSLPIEIKAELRHYQQDGINWMRFLNQYQLHGILCDDMGLGKTLQSICILASDHHLKSLSNEKPNPSLVICPPTLTAHWQLEINQYVSNLTSLLYFGNPNERKRLRARFLQFDVIIMSYEILRNDLEHFQDQKFNYLILDEGHIIKNTKTKITKTIKQIQAQHRLILSGTPIQNNVLELWSLFDFLMPGFLGTEKQFNQRYSKPILASKDPKSNPKDQEKGALALDQLHKQVLPFLLRRMKEDVLSDLPPKIIQDFVVELSDLQKILYEDFSKKQSLGSNNKTHIFQSLQYLKKLCNHPCIVLNDQHPQYQSLIKKYDIADISHSSKLMGLKQLLNDCGIGLGNQDLISNHRVLIFCQMKQMLDIIESSLLKHLPSVTYLRLDGSVEAMKRQLIVQQFNQDPSIDLLLLTTHVGGLGLNLTGADTVIFVEHDWNPMKDLQAMDRAHRLGQKKVVNVYRLITKDTLEMKIMGLQKFKLNIANSVINQDNSHLDSMDTNQILDLFSLHDNKNNDGKTKSKDGKLSLKEVIESAEQIEEGDDYLQFDSENFLKQL